MDHTDALIDALHEAYSNGGRLVLAQDVTINGVRHAAGVYELRWVAPAAIKKEG